MATATEYDLIVIGSGPGGQKAAVAAAKLGKTVAVVEHGHMLGGVCVNTGTIPSKTLREAVLHLTGMNQCELYGASYRVKEKITPADLQERTSHVIKREVDVIRDQLVRNHIDLFTGHGSFLDANTVRVEGPIEAEHRTLTGEFIVIATGTTPRRPDGVDFDDERVLDSDEIVNLDFIPTSMVVVGAGVIGPRTSSTTTTPWSTESKSRGEAPFLVGGKALTLKKHFIEDVRAADLRERIRTLRRALLVMHSPTDNTVGIANASDIFRTARHPRSFVSLEGADHLLTGKNQAARAARIVSAWADPYL